MAVPKHRTSRAKVGQRRNHQKARRVTVTECPHCHEPKLPHRVCPSCGYYNGMEIVKPKEKKKE